MLKLRSFTIEKLFELLKDSCLKESLFWTERKSYANADNDFVKPSERDEMVAFLSEVCEREDMDLSVETFSLCVTLLDRFLSTFKVKSKYLECLAVSCLYIACKVKEEDDKISVTSEFLIDCDCKCSIAELLRMEQMVLTKFEWSINDTTAADFLQIYFALLVNEYKKVESTLETLMSNKSAWKPMAKSAVSKTKSDMILYPPGQMDFLEALEAKLKQCLCVNDLTNMYKPHVLAYSLISLEMDKVFESIGSDLIKNSLGDMLETIKQYCKLSFELVDKCKEQLKSHLASVENTKTLFDNYFDEYYHWKIRNLKQSSIFVSPLSAVNTQLDAIKEEEEIEEQEEEEDFEDEQEYDNENVDIAEESCDISDYVTKKEDTQVMGNSSPSYMFSNTNFFANINNSTDNQYQSLFFEKSKLMNISYADMLTGRQDCKRKLSENSVDEEIDCD